MMNAIRFSTKTVFWFLFLFLFYTMTTTSCQSSKTGDSPINPFFPQQQEAQPDSMDALTVGKLVLDDNCLRVQDSDNNNYLLVWPQSYSLNVAGENVQVKDDTGKIVVQVGDVANVSGGEVPADQIGNYVAQATMPADCPGPFWLVASVTTTR